MPPRIPEEDLLDELRRLADELDKTPSGPDMAADGEYSPSTYRRRFGSWNGAIETAGLEPRPVGAPREVANQLVEMDPEEWDLRQSADGGVDE